MKKAILGFLGVCLLIVGSCSKSSNSPVAGTWTLGNATLTDSSCVGVASTLTATTSTFVTDSGSLTFNFSGSALPVTGGTFTVVGGFANPGNNQVSITAAVGSIHSNTGYSATGGNGTNQTVKVTVGTNGKLTVSGTNIEMAQNLNHADSTTLNFNVTQQ